MYHSCNIKVNDTRKRVFHNIKDNNNTGASECRASREGGGRWFEKNSILIWRRCEWELQVVSVARPMASHAVAAIWWIYGCNKSEVRDWRSGQGELIFFILIFAMRVLSYWQLLLDVQRLLTGPLKKCIYIYALIY